VEFQGAGAMIQKNQKFHYTYNSTNKELLWSIESGKLTPELADLMEDSNNGSSYYYEGCLLAEVRDYRKYLEPNPETTLPNSISTFISKKIFLRPTQSTLLNDVQQIMTKNPQYTQDDMLALEEVLLLNNVTGEQPLCLDPSPKVFLVNNIVHYNRNKFNTHGHRTNLLRSLESNSTSANTTQPLYPTTSADTSKLPLLKFILAREQQSKSYLSNEEPFPIAVHQVLNQYLNSQSPSSAAPMVLSTASPNTICEQMSPIDNPLESRKVRFHGNAGKTFAAFQISSKKDQNGAGYEGTLRVGKTPDNGSNGDMIKFALGNAAAAQLFIVQLKSLYEQEGIGVLVFDSLNPPMQVPHATQPMLAHPSSAAALLAMHKQQSRIMTPSSFQMMELAQPSTENVNGSLNPESALNEVLQVSEQTKKNLSTKLSNTT